MTTYDIHKIKEKQKLVKLANYGSQVRKKMRPKVLIGDGENKQFIEGDILDANAVQGLIEDTYDKSRVFRAFSKEGKEINKDIEDLQEKVEENYEQLDSTITDNKEELNAKLKQLSDHIDDVESSIPNLRRVVDIRPYNTSEDGTKTYLVTKQNDVQEQMIIEGGKKGEKGDKGDPFTYEDFTDEQIENLKVKGDRGVSIVSAQQTKVSYVANGINEYTIILDDGTITTMQVRNGGKGDLSIDYFNNNAVTNGKYNEETQEIQLFTPNGTMLIAINAAPFIKDGMVSNAEIKDGFLVITFNTDAGKSEINIPITDIFDPDNYYTKEQIDQNINNAVEIEKTRAESAERNLEEKLLEEIQRATVAEQVLEDNLHIEAVNRKTEDERLEALIKEQSDNCEQAIQDLEDKIDSEITRATEAEQALEDSINKEVDRATKAEADLQNAIDEEKNRAETAENALSEAIEKEVEDREAADNDIREQLEAEIERSTKADEDLKEALDKIGDVTEEALEDIKTSIEEEKNRATQAESDLQDKIDSLEDSINKEIQRATDAESTLQDNIDEESNRAQTVEQELQKDIDALEDKLNEGEDRQVLVTTENGPEWINRWKTLESPYKFVDMGLSVDWCTCNIGANSPEEYGWYFMWGDTTAYNSDRTPVGGGEAISFNWANYPLCDGSVYKLTKYNSISSYGIVDNKTVLEPKDDAAHVHIGGNCRMPTYDEYEELINACKTTYTTSYNSTGIKGWVLRLKADPSKELFFPAAGLLNQTSWNNSNSYGYYWASTIPGNTTYYAHFLSLQYISTAVICEMRSLHRSYGYSVRAVKPKS